MTSCDVVLSWQHVKSDHERQREMYQSGGSMEWDSGKKWGQGIPQGGAVNKNEVILINQGACGAFVQSLEDEYMGETFLCGYLGITKTHLS